jgi:hypothetical protein
MLSVTFIPFFLFFFIFRALTRVQWKGKRAGKRKVLRKAKHQNSGLWHLHGKHQSMLHLNLPLWIGLLLFVASCSVSDSGRNMLENVPWAEATFLDPLPTTITFTNSDTVARDFRIKLDRYLDDVAAEFPESLSPGQSVTVTAYMHRPRYLFYQVGYYRPLLLLLPGLSRHLTVKDNEVVEIGSFASEYNYMDCVMKPFQQVGRQAPSLENVAEYYRMLDQKSSQHFDTFPHPAELPPYIVPLVERAVVASTYKQALSAREYYTYFYSDTLPVATVLTDSIAAFLMQSSYNATPDYTNLYETFARFRGEKNTDANQSLTTNHTNSITLAYLGGNLSPGHRNDAIATYLSKLMTSGEVYFGKMENIDALYFTLPPAYQQALDVMERKANKRRVSTNGLTEFLTTPLLALDGTERDPGKVGKKPLRLFKFWFAGCTPCLKQQPYEKTLLATHLEIDLIYVVHSTDEEVWPKYLEKHQPPANYQLYVAKNQTKAVRQALGGLGAPSYLMLNADNEVVCQPCPKPSDPLLGEVINGAMKGQVRE